MLTLEMKLMQLPVKLELYRSFGVEVAKLRSCPPAPLALPESTRYFSPVDLGIEVVTIKAEEVKTEEVLQLDSSVAEEEGGKAEITEL